LIPNYLLIQKSLQEVCLLFDQSPNLTKKIQTYHYRGTQTLYKWQWGFQKGMNNLKLLNNPRTEYSKNKLALAKRNPFKILIKIHLNLIAVEELGALILERGTLQMISDTKLKYLKSGIKLICKGKNLKKTSKSDNRVQALNNVNNKLVSLNKERIQEE
jgi:hypothetical protein